MQGSVSAFTDNTPKQWLENWKKNNPTKTVTSFFSSKYDEDRHSVQLSFEKQENK